MATRNLCPKCSRIGLSLRLTSLVMSGLVVGLLQPSADALEVPDVMSSTASALESVDHAAGFSMAERVGLRASVPLSPSVKSEDVVQPIAEPISDPPSSEVSVDELRRQLQVRPLLMPKVYYPGSGARIPEAFGAEWGDVFLTISGATKDRVRTTHIDSSISTGFGLGNPQDLVGIELTYNILSTRTKFAVNGSFDVKVHRRIFEAENFWAAVALGVNNFYSYGPEAKTNASSAYGVVSGLTYLRPNNPASPMALALTLGAGGAPVFADGGVGFLAGAGLEVHPQIGLGSSWNGKAFSLGASFLPFTNLPLTLSAEYNDVFNMTRQGHRLILSLEYNHSFN